MVNIPNGDQNEHPLRILVVDDDPDFIELLIAQLAHIPRAQVTAAHDPGDALERLNRSTFELVVSDWAIDATTGGAVLSAADEHHCLQSGSKGEPRTPVIFISGSEKVCETHRLHNLKHFEPVSFVSKRCGPSLISTVAEQILRRFTKLSPVRSHLAVGPNFAVNSL